MATYRGLRRDDGQPVVTVDGLTLNPRTDLMNHSPDGLEWGYQGSGPAQLALAILAHHFGLPVPAPRGALALGADTPEIRVIRLHQPFKVATVARFPRHASWSLTTDEVDAALDAIRTKRQNGEW